ncbi:MAG: helix-turn-helix domain-containing protein [Proteobacteria bacterium]|nr:helix-turn-helix domain-containing protein [Pseudomonadota bacterium]
MRIGELGKQSGTLVETIRYYEQVGLMPAPPRTQAGYREYRPEHLQRLIFLRRCRELGFSIEEIRSLLRLAEQRNQSCATVTRAATQHLNDIRGKLADLRQLAQGLQTMIDSCTGGRIADCKILEALTRVSASPAVSRRGNSTRRRGTQ